ncbi:DDB1- and CUL4-associated factor 5 [Anthonomus grandis grandis]|uniref:DDB1- and CUL4-associated factor 5 n=1 Tax=Anthonomus grandis grandis TaxID=2921223 RepID=UPI0021667C7A|nr:DDB1- and CUL4-associated factor 5 [Anthonomus grandis grandis]
MAGPSVINPLKYIVNRQYDSSLVIKNRIFKERLAKAKNFYRKDLFAHYGCVNAIEFSAEGELLASGGDDRRVLLWNLSEAVFDRGLSLAGSHMKVESRDSGLKPKTVPNSMKKTHNSNIFCLAFDSKNERIFSGGNDDQVIVHEIFTGNPLVALPHRKPVYGLSINPQNDEIIATAGDDGRLLLYDIRETTGQEAQVLARQKTGFHSVMFNPVNPRFVVSANSEEGIALWDCRKPKEELLHYDSIFGKTPGISACFDSKGKRVLGIRRRLPPVLYNTECEQSICQFYHPQYYNSCTMKTCSFAGENDEYILSGSDDFNLYMWKIPEDEDEWGASHVVLKGHRSIVNQVRYNKHNNLIASSGVEKMIKLWSTIPIGTWTGSLLKEYSDPARIVYTHREYLDLVGTTGERISHDYSDQSTLEDSRMMAFFDSLIQREIEGWASSDEILTTTDSDSDLEHDYSKLLHRIFRSRSKSVEEPRKNKYNKIAQLISKKRLRLARMAYKKAPSSVHKSLQKEKRRKKEKKALKRSKERFNGKRHKRNHETRRSKYFGERNTRSLRYRTRQCLIQACENAGIAMLLDVPSTSTGITTTSSRPTVYRVIDQDSEDEAVSLVRNGLDSDSSDNENGNLVNILPTPLNGTHENVINNLEVPNASREVIAAPSREVLSSSSNGVVRNSEQEFNNGASTSRGTTTAVLPKKRRALKREYFLKSRPASCSDSDEDEGSQNGHVSCTTSTDSENEFDHGTPPPNKKRSLSYSDSGCGTGPSSTKSSRFMNKYVRFNRTQEEEEGEEEEDGGQSSEEDERREEFRKRVRKARVNLRRRTYADSDSN